MHSLFLFYTFLLPFFRFLCYNNPKEILSKGASSYGYF